MYKLLDPDKYTLPIFQGTKLNSISQNSRCTLIAFLQSPSRFLLFFSECEIHLYRSPKSLYSPLRPMWTCTFVVLGYHFAVCTDSTVCYR